MKQYQAVIETLEKLGGVATLGRLYQEAPKIEKCVWGTKTPFASIRRIVQLRGEIYKIKPGLYGLESYRSRIEKRGIFDETNPAKDSSTGQEFDHYYYQGLLLLLGNSRHFSTFAPNQDKNKLFLDKKLGELRTLQSMPEFSYPRMVQRSSTIDVIWFNDRGMPSNFFEIESTTDIQNSLLKFSDLQDFYVHMFIVADVSRNKEFQSKLAISSFKEIRSRVKFLDYESVTKQYEIAVEREGIRTDF